MSNNQLVRYCITFHPHKKLNKADAQEFQDRIPELVKALTDHTRTSGALPYGNFRGRPMYENTLEQSLLSFSNQHKNVVVCAELLGNMTRRIACFLNGGTCDASVTDNTPVFNLSDVRKDTASDYKERIRHQREAIDKQMEELKARKQKLLQNL